MSDEMGRDPADMEAVGNALMDAIEKDFASHPFMKGWHPADCPTEIVGDLLNALDEAAHPVEAEALEEAWDTLEKLRADLAEEDAEHHAQRIAVLDLTLARARSGILSAEKEVGK